MGFFDFLFKKNKKNVAKYDKYGDVLKRELTTKDQRLEAIEALEDLKPEIAIPQLLKRFEMVVESGLQDSKEKERCLKIILKNPEIAKPFLLDYLTQKHRVAWPLRIAEAIFTKQEYTDLILKNLSHQMVIFDEEIIERNEELLKALKEVPSQHEIINALKPFLVARHERIRLAALECLATHAKHIESAYEALLELAQTPITDDNSRFMGLVKNTLGALGRDNTKQ